MSNPSDYIDLNNQIDAILSSDDALQVALNSDNPLLRVAARLTNNVHPVLPATIKQTIWNNMMQVLPSSASAGIIRPDFSAWMSRVAAILVIVIVAGIVARPASAGSLPGDILYPVKLTFEQLELRLANSPGAMAETYLNHAEERLQELEQLPPESQFTGTTLQSAMEHVQTASTIAWENALVEQDIILLEELQSVVITIEQQLVSVVLADEVVASIQLSLDVVNGQLSATPPIEILPESTEIPVELTVEVTESVPEATAESTVETDDTTVQLPEDDSPDYIVVEPFTLYVHPDGRVNMRSGAGTNFDISATANQNTPVTVIGQNASGDWYLVRLPNGTEGWIFVELLDDTPGRSGNVNGNSNGNRNGNANGNSNGNSNGNASGNRTGNGNAQGN